MQLNARKLIRESWQNWDAPDGRASRADIEVVQGLLGADVVTTGAASVCLMRLLGGNSYTSGISLSELIPMFQEIYQNFEGQPNVKKVSQECSGQHSKHRPRYSQHRCLTCQSSDLADWGRLATKAQVAWQIWKILLLQMVLAFPPQGVPRSQTFPYTMKWCLLPIISICAILRGKLSRCPRRQNSKFRLEYSKHAALRSCMISPKILLENMNSLSRGHGEASQSRDGLERLTNTRSSARVSGPSLARMLLVSMLCVCARVWCDGMMACALWATIALCLHVSGVGPILSCWAFLYSAPKTSWLIICKGSRNPDLVLILGSVRSLIFWTMTRHTAVR